MGGLLCIGVKKSPLLDIYSYRSATKEIPKIGTMPKRFSLGWKYQICLILHGKIHQSKYNYKGIQLGADIVS